MNLSMGRARLHGAPGSLARYRQRASECRAAGERSPTLEERALWLKLAQDWQELIGDVESRVEHWSALNAPPPPPAMPARDIHLPEREPLPVNVRSWPDKTVRVLRGIRAA